MTTIASQITSLTVVYSTVYSGPDQRNIKAPSHWPLCGEFTGTGEIPAQRASYAENVSIWWRHHVDAITYQYPKFYAGLPDPCQHFDESVTSSIWCYIEKYTDTWDIGML